MYSLSYDARLDPPDYPEHETRYIPLAANHQAVMVYDLQDDEHKLVRFTDLANDGIDSNRDFPPFDSAYTPTVRIPDSWYAVPTSGRDILDDDERHFALYLKPSELEGVTLRNNPDGLYQCLFVAANTFYHQLACAIKFAELYGKGTVVDEWSPMDHDPSYMRYRRKPITINI